MKTLHWLQILLCKHEGVKRSENGRLFLECIKCGAVSPGVDLITKQERSKPALPRL